VTAWKVGQVRRGVIPGYTTSPVVYTVTARDGAGWRISHNGRGLQILEATPSTLIGEETLTSTSEARPQLGQVWRVVNAEAVRGKLGDELVLLERLDHPLVGKGWRLTAPASTEDGEWITDGAFSDGTLEYAYSMDVNSPKFAALASAPSRLLTAYKAIIKRKTDPHIARLASVGAPPEMLRDLQDLADAGHGIDVIMKDFAEDAGKKGGALGSAMAEGLVKVMQGDQTKETTMNSNDQLKQATMERDAYKEAFERTQQGPTARYGYLHSGPFAAVNPENGKPMRRVLVVVGGEVVSVEADVKVLPEAETRSGTLLRLNAKTGAVLAVEKDASIGGVVVVVKAVPSPSTVEIEFGGMQRQVVKSSQLVVEPGDRLVCDSTVTVALRSLGKEKSGYAVAEEVNVSWDDVAGQEAARAALIDAIETPILHAEMFKRYNRVPSKGVLLSGPPGCGKTLLAKAAATSFAKLQGGGTAGFIYVKGPEILNKWVGESESKIRALFARAREHYKLTGQRAIMFIDEADAILSTRGSQRSSDVDKTIVPAFLAEMDGLDGGGPMLILATNRPDALDPAVVRDGRIDRKVSVLRPKQPAAQAIVELYLQRKPLQEPLRELAQRMVEEIFSGRHVIAKFTGRRETLEGGHEDKEFTFTIERILSGAMLAGMVERAAERAMRRDMEACSQEASGISFGDLEEAINDTAKSENPTAHLEELFAWANEMAIEHKVIENQVKGKKTIAQA
jgi:proteasome ATPase